MTVDERVDAAVADLTGLVRDTVEILDALEDGGREHLYAHYPPARADLDELLEQMRTTVTGALRVARIIPNAALLDPAKPDFDAHLDRATRRIERSMTNVSNLKASCTEVGVLERDLLEIAGKKTWRGLLGPKPAHSARLAELIGRVFLNDGDMADRVWAVLTAASEVCARVVELRKPAGEQTLASNAAATAELQRQAARFSPLVGELEQTRRRFSALLDPTASG